MLKALNISKNYGSHIILNNLNLELEAGTSCAIVGKSGIGKSTLLHILGTLDSPDQGMITLNTHPITSKNADEFRQKHIGFIFQNYNVLEDFTVLENLKIASMIRNISYDEQACLEMLDMVNLKHKSSTMTRLLSGGEKQRLAIARALIHRPKIIFADEPTGSLDQSQATIIEELLMKGVKEGHVSLIIVTHDLELAKKCDRIYQLKDGILNEYL
jgi:lipoprotein-releasing system ATP-binding protein